MSYAVLVVSLLALGCTVVWTNTHPAEPPTTPAIPAVQELPLTRENLLMLVNAERAKVGVAPLVIDERLNQSAQMKADDMATYDYWSHTNNDGTQGYEFAAGTMRETCSYVSENYTGMPNKSALSANEATTWWKNSESHYDAMVDPKYTATGFGIKPHLAVQHFCQVR